MIDLVRHIEILLLENDCVVVPGFGGFIAHYMPAVWNETEEVFYPPVRAIGFNAQLKINDGILVQSYMESYRTDFSDANRILQKDIERLVDTLHGEGRLDLGNIGEISISVQGLYLFSPYENKLLSPVFYGVECFDFKYLNSLKPGRTVSLFPVESPTPRKNYEIRISRTFVRNAVAVAAAVFLFFYLSAPIENTYVEKHNYAQLLLTDLLSEKHSLLTTPVANPVSKDTSQRSIVVKEVKVPKAPNKVPAAPREEKLAVIAKPYHIIVGSVAKRDEADAVVANLKTDYPDAGVIDGDGKIRISLVSYSTREEANKQLIEIRKKSTYKDAWLLFR